ncbi:helix-hairpin-helix domain-containing protein [Liquorilactobacillus vini]|uniref:helix-hairpin-helix domain-containing protein n=1 Tax=Liquorilactobacillus vini TaxID=238015 RepID=UPI00029AC639|nr:helix-hairpin-helix domain-containing protein [Liquorilactobacillus vini]
MERLREFLEENRARIVVILIAIGLIIGGVFWYSYQQTNLTSGSEIKLTKTKSSNKDAATVTKSSSRAPTFYVDIKGAVQKPGVYRMTSQQRVNDVVLAAGGFLTNADQNQVNLSLKLYDQQIIYVPIKGEIQDQSLPTTIEQTPTEAATASSGAVTASAAESSVTTTKFDLNTATKEQLMQINGIGEKKAELIINYRQEHGQFKQLDELKDISGIGDKTLEVLKENLTLGQE